MGAGLFHGLHFLIGAVFGSYKFNTHTKRKSKIGLMIILSKEWMNTIFGTGFPKRHKINFCENINRQLIYFMTYI